MSRRPDGVAGGIGSAVTVCTHMGAHRLPNRGEHVNRPANVFQAGRAPGRWDGHDRRSPPASVDVSGCNYVDDMKSWIDRRLGETYPGHEVSLVFVRGLSADAAAERLDGLPRQVLESGSSGGWAWAVHDSFSSESGDFGEVDYRPLCEGEGEVEGEVEAVVFLVEPCSAKAHSPDFTYYRDGRCVLHFSFEDLGQRLGDNPDHLSAELLEAGLIGPDTYCDLEDEDGHECFDHLRDDGRDDDRLVRTIATAFGLPSPPLAAEVVG